MSPKTAGVCSVNSQVGEDEVYHAFTNPGKDPLLSQDELSIIFQRMLGEDLYRVNLKDYPGVKIKSIVHYMLGIYQDDNENLPNFILEAFPDAKNLLELVLVAMESGDIILDCVPKSAMADSLMSVKAISLFKNDKIRLIFGYDFLKINEHLALSDEFYQEQVTILPNRKMLTD